MFLNYDDTLERQGLIKKVKLQMKTAQEIFGEIEEIECAKPELRTKIMYEKYYSEEEVKNAINKVLCHNGCKLDVVQNDYSICLKCVLYKKLGLDE
jgi:ABC-type enterochelin transport system substrate-binding protein